MSKRWSINWWGPSSYDFHIVMVRIEAVPQAGGLFGWYSLTIALIGFGVSLTRWRNHKLPDVYGDGGVA